MIVGILIFVDDLHDFVAVPEWLHWLPDFAPIIVFGFHFEHLYIGAILILIALIMAYYA
ncbi:MAG: hypothetical protein ACXADL_11630 [Candidatus Thorarchaeota archaeon]